MRKTKRCLLAIRVSTCSTWSTSSAMLLFELEIMVPDWHHRAASLLKELKMSNLIIETEICSTCSVETPQKQPRARYTIQIDATAF